MTKKSHVLLDLFSGIGGFHKGLSEAGIIFDETYFSEIDKHAIANYKFNFKDAKYIGGVESILSSGIRRPTIITFGSPCQDFSLAGKRKGLGGSRSSLIEYALSAISHFRPDIFIWENVKGTFSSNAGEDFWAIIQTFANIGGYELEWQLVNTSWLLPQNRERIYLIGHLTTPFRDWKRIFPFEEDEKLYYQRKLSKSNSNTQIAKTLNANDAKSWVGNFIHITSATKDGYEIAMEGDSINLQYPDSKTRRGRIGKGVAQTLDCNCKQGVIQPTIVAQRGRPDKNGKTEQQIEERKDGLTNTLTSVQKDNLLLENNNIRRLTEIECERLQGFPDDWTKYGIYDKQVWINKKEKTYKIVEGVQEISKTQRFKMCGNAVTCKMVELIGGRIKINLDKIAMI